MNKSYSQKQKLLIDGENCNVSKTTDVKQFFILVFTIIFIIILIYSLCNIVTEVFITCMSNKTQAKIESLFQGFFYCSAETNTKYENQINSLKEINHQIIQANAPALNHKEFKICAVEDKNVNAFITPDGSIFFTSALLDRNLPEEQLAFVLSHEVGHYANRDHLKSLSREILANAMVQIIFSNDTTQDFINGAYEFNSLRYSRKKEINADLFAKKTLIKIYGNQNGAVEFIKMLQQEEKAQELLYYFSTHPSNSQRIKILEK